MTNTYEINGHDIRKCQKIFHKEAACLELHSQSPKQISTWINNQLKKLTRKGWKNLTIDTYSTEEDPDNLGIVCLIIYGDKLETKKEAKERVQLQLHEWHQEYDGFLMKLMFYSSQQGKNHIKEIVKTYPIWNGYPESSKEFVKQLQEFRNQFEK